MLNIGVESCDLQPIIAKSGFAEPSDPGLHERAERTSAKCFPVRTEHQGRSHRQSSVALGVLIGAQHLVGYAVFFKDAGGTVSMVSFRRERESAGTVRARKPRRLSKPNQLRQWLHVGF